MTRTLAAFALLWSAGTVGAAESPIEPLPWVYQYVFATADSEGAFEPLLQHLHNDENLQEATLDFVAEALVSPLNRQMPAPAKLLLARFLIKHSAGRYRLVVESALQDADVAGLRDMAKGYRRWRRATGEEPYVPGTIDFAQLREQYAAVALAYEPTDAVARKLAALPAESSIEDMFEHAGTPHLVVSGTTEASDGLVTIRIRRLSVYYRGIGRVVFAFRKYDRWQSQGVVIDPLAFEAKMPYRQWPAARVTSADESLGLAQLLSGHPMAMKVAVESRWRPNSATPEFMDATAEVLLAQHAGAQTAHDFDVYAWMCKLLSSYGGPRYAGVLAAVARDTHDEKLRRFASLPIQHPDGANTAPYVAGSVSLAEMRARYPALYPGRTFVSGAL